MISSAIWANFTYKPRMAKLKMNNHDKIKSLTKSLIEDCKIQCPNICNAIELSHTQRDKIRLCVEKGGLIPADASLVVFGSLARNEATQGSDIDWSLLIDGQANGEHHDAALAIKSELSKTGLPMPGVTGTFGTLIFSHDLVHQIGGDDDTNRNTTRRVLLLLESCPIESSNSRPVYERVAKQIVNRYLEQEPDVLLPDGTRRIPRFLLNDVVRYWRTMAVDYARKVRDRNAEGWALRNIKLRLSRKLTFVSGMLSCLDYRLNPHRGENGGSLFNATGMKVLDAQEHIRKCVATTPLDIVSRSIEGYSPDETHKAELVGSILGSYDTFLGILNDEEKRKRLKGLRPGEHEKDPIFQECRELGVGFQNGLSTLFFETNDELTKATQEYGVF